MKRVVFRRGENEEAHVARTAERLRAMTTAYTAAETADPCEVNARLRRMAYGGSRWRNRDTVPDPA